MPAFSPAPTGLAARVFGAPAGSATTRNYWVQAIYVDGSRSLFAGPVTVNNTPGSLGGGFTSQSGVTNVGTGVYVSVTWNYAPGAVAYDVVCTSTTTYPSGQSNIGVVVGTTANATADVTPAAPGTSPYLLYTPKNTSYLGVNVSRYDFTADGGAVSTLTPLGTDAVIPAGAIVIISQFKVTVAFAGATATLSMGTTAGSSNTAFLNAVAVASLTANAIIAGAATIAAPVRLTAAGLVNVTIGTAAFTAGSGELYLVYFVPTE